MPRKKTVLGLNRSLLGGGDVSNDNNGALGNSFSGLTLLTLSAVGWVNWRVRFGAGVLQYPPIWT